MKKRKRNQKPDLSTPEGVQAALLVIAKAAKSTGAEIDYAVYLLLRLARMMSDQIGAAPGEPDTFTLAMHAVTNPPPRTGESDTRDLSVN